MVRGRKHVESRCVPPVRTLWDVLGPGEEGESRRHYRVMSPPRQQYKSGDYSIVSHLFRGTWRFIIASLRLWLVMISGDAHMVLQNSIGLLPGFICQSAGRVNLSV